jgi:hypothetical protein
MRVATYDELNDLCRGITRSFVHLETRDSYGTEVELPNLAKWRLAPSHRPARNSAHGCVSYAERRD